MRKKMKAFVCATLILTLFITLPMTAFAESVTVNPESAQPLTDENIMVEQMINLEKSGDSDQGMGSETVEAEPPVEPEQPIVPTPEPDKPSKPKLLDRPTIKLTRVSDTGKTKISWEKIKGAERYRVYCSSTANGT